MDKKKEAQPQESPLDERKKPASLSASVLKDHVSGFLKDQLNDAKSAYLDLKGRVQKELKSSRVRPTQAPSVSQRDVKLAPVVQRVEPPPGRFRRVLVVGGMEFFGTALVHHLNTQGVRDIVVANALGGEGWRNLPALRFEDFVTIEELEGLLNSRGDGLGVFSHVFYLAGWSDGGRPLALPKALVTHVGNKGGRLISLSSACSMGANPPNRGAVSLQPENFRPVTKAGVMACLFDRHVRAHLGAKQWLSLKHHRLFGPGEQVDGALYGLATVAYRQIVSNGRVELPNALRKGAAEGDRQHDFLSVWRAARMAAFLACNETANGFIEIGSGAGTTALELVHAVFEALDMQPVIDWVDKPFESPSVQPDTTDLSRLRELGWEDAQPSFRDDIRQYVKMLQESKMFVEEENRPLVTEPEESSGGRAARPRRKPFVPKSA